MLRTRAGNSEYVPPRSRKPDVDTEPLRSKHHTSPPPLPPLRLGLTSANRLNNSLSSNTDLNTQNINYGNGPPIHSANNNKWDPSSYHEKASHLDPTHPLSLQPSPTYYPAPVYDRGYADQLNRQYEIQQDDMKPSTLSPSWESFFRGRTDTRSDDDTDTESDDDTDTESDDDDNVGPFTTNSSDQDTSLTPLNSMLSGMTLQSRKPLTFKAAMANTPINSTISRDNTAGEHARQAKLFAHFSTRLRHCAGGTPGFKSPSQAPSQASRSVSVPQPIPFSTNADRTSPHPSASQNLPHTQPSMVPNDRPEQGTGPRGYDSKGSSKPKKDPHTLEREARARERLLKEAQRIANMGWKPDCDDDDAGSGSRKGRRTASSTTAGAGSGRRSEAISGGNEEERMRRLEAEREGDRWDAVPNQESTRPYAVIRKYLYKM